MADWGDVQTYNDMIDDLQSFAAAISETCNVLAVAAQTCVDAMESDKASLQAAGKVAMSCKKYEEAIALAAGLANSLGEERDDLIEYLRALESMDEE